MAAGKDERGGAVNLLSGYDLRVEVTVFGFFQEPYKGSSFNCTTCNLHQIPDPSGHFAEWHMETAHPKSVPVIF